MKVNITLSALDEMLERRGLGPNGAARRLLTVECARQMDPYVPMRQGTLKNTRIIGPDYVEYRGPYAHFQHKGLLMLGVKTGSAYAKSGEPKRYAVPEKELQYNGAPKRGAYWERRMWADKGRQITRKVAAAVGGKAE